FFSSRRRHTRFSRDWSSDVCSSDLKLKDQLRKRESDTEKLMRAFINPGKEIIDKFTDWSSDAHRLRENAEFVDEFIDLLERIEEIGRASCRERVESRAVDVAVE